CQRTCRLECFALIFLCRLLEHPPALGQDGVLMTGQGLTNDRNIPSISTEQAGVQIGQECVVHREQSQSGMQLLLRASSPLGFGMRPSQQWIHPFPVVFEIAHDSWDICKRGTEELVSQHLRSQLSINFEASVNEE